MRVGLFVTCLLDLLRPRIGFAAIRLLQAAGCEVVVPVSQTCCGQPPTIRATTAPRAWATKQPECCTSPRYWRGAIVEVRSMHFKARAAEAAADRAPQAVGTAKGLFVEGASAPWRR